jgi:hypothetical protein
MCCLQFQQPFIKGIMQLQQLLNRKFFKKLNCIDTALNGGKGCMKTYSKRRR